MLSDSKYSNKITLALKEVRWLKKKKKLPKDFPGDTVDESPSPKAGETGSIPDRVKFHRRCATKPESHKY